MPEITGPGAAFFDFDQDGDLDIYLINGHTELPSVDPNASTVNRLFRQEANGHFIDVTEKSGLGDNGYGMGVAIGDIDNNGYPDVYVTNYGRDRLYRNRGDGTFEDITELAGINVGNWSCSAAFVDYDRDGFLDLYVTRYVEYNPNNDCFDGAGRIGYCAPIGRPPITDVLLRNNGNATFSNVSDLAGISTIAAAGLGVVCDDFNGDGWQDIYVANDKYANILWINQQNGTFRDKALLTGTAYNAQGMAEAGMGVVAADLDNDLRLDLFVTHLRNETNTFYRNLGANIGFGDSTAGSGLSGSSIALTGFGTAAFDAELDGDLDLVIGNGAVVRGPIYPGAEIAHVLARYAQPNLFYINDGSGHFTPLMTEASSLTNRVEVTRGLTTGDVDNDGDRDILLCNIQGQVRLYRNDAPNRGHWLGVRARDPALKRDAIGARITVTFEGRRLVRTVRRADSFLSSGDPRVHFGLGRSTHIDQIEVQWPDGLLERFSGTSVDHYTTVSRGSGKPPT